MCESGSDRMDIGGELIHSGTKKYFRKQPPTDLNSSTNLSILENQPAGTFVKFTAVDPNDAIAACGWEGRSTTGCLNWLKWCVARCGKFRL